MTDQETTTTVRNDDALSDQLQSMCNSEGITLIWYDTKLNVPTRQQLKIAKKHLRAINDFVIFHKNEQDCINTITSIKNEKIILVTCGSGANSLLSFDHELVHRSVQAVFIFCRHKNKYEFLREHYSKIIGIFTDSEELKSSIKTEVMLIQTLYETFNFYNKKEEKSIVNLSKQSATFLWLLVFKHLVVRMPKNEKVKSEMVETCKKYYHGNKYELKNIQNFDKDYKPELAIHWYTKSSFVYKLVNKALRFEDVEQLYVFRFYISDLCEEIDKRHKQITEQRSWKFYRGARLPLEDVEKFKQSEGKLISTNGFLSTSLSKTVAIEFALRKTLKDTEESVLLEIECNNESATFAFIGNDSVHPEEEEVLFDLGATFEVLSVTKSREENTNIDIWIVKVRSTQEGNELAQLYIGRSQEMLKHGAPAEMLWGTTLASMGQLDKSIKYFEKLPDANLSGVPIDQIFRAIDGSLSGHEKYDEALEYMKLKHKKLRKNNMVTPTEYFMKGNIYMHKGQYDQALAEHWKCIRLIVEISGEDTLLTASTYVSIGEIHYLKGQYQLALDNFSKSKEIGEKYYQANHIFFAGVFRGFGDVYKEKGELHRAMQFYQTVVDMYEKYFPEGSASIFLKMGHVLDKLGDYDKGLDYYHRVVEITQKRHDDELRKSITNFEATGRIHKLKGEFQQALESFEESLKIMLQTLGSNHPYVACSYYTKGTVLEHLDRNDEALTAYQTALTIQKTVFLDGHRNMARSLYSIGNQFRRKGELALAKRHCDEALAMQKLLPPNHIDTSFTLSHIGTILYDQGEYDESLKYLWKALKIQKIFSNGAPHRYQLLTLITIGHVNVKLNNLDLALKCLKDALSIKEKFFSQQYSQLSQLRRKIEEVEQLKIS